VGFWWLGELYQEKSFIGKRFLEHATGTGLVCDISWHEKDRIYGDEWVRFMESCRCMLGTESGASVIDFTGDIERTVRDHCSAHPEATFGEVQDRFFKDREGLIRMNQISPRAFESIACGCCLVLFEGDYSGVLKPGIHYIELKKDFSNFAGVLEKIRDRETVKRIARRAFDDVIRSSAYSYRSFIALFDRKIEEYIHLHGQGRNLPSLAEVRDRAASGSVRDGIRTAMPFALRLCWLAARSAAGGALVLALRMAHAAKRRYLLHSLLREERQRLLKMMLHID
jgi:hypothetical protein